ncbi:MAG: hypothetical protein CL936_03330, partial [Deltaproteobacteria bacterium]|nr:hypothetical protein [Deltaproteobacteria bacterium]
GSFIEAFRVASQVASFSNTTQSVVLLCRAWINLEEIGIAVLDIDPRFDGFSKPSELLFALISELRENGQETSFLQPLLARALLVQGEPAAASQVVEQFLAGAVDPEIAKSLAVFALNRNLALPSNTLQILEERKEEYGIVDEMVLFTAAQIKGKSGLAEYVSFLEAELEGRTDPFAQRAIGLALLELAERRSETGDEGFDRIMSAGIQPQDMDRLMMLAIRLGNREKAAELVREARESFGIGSRDTVLAEGRFVIAFDAENEASIVNAIARIDPLVSAGDGGPAVDAVLARLLAMGELKNVARSIEILQGSVLRHPESWKNAVLLLQALQETGRLAEADDIATVLFQRRDRGTLKQRAQLATLFARQGRLLETAALICEIADETGESEDLFRCFQLQSQIGNMVEANRILDSLEQEVSRSPEIEVAIASRYLEEGDPEKSISYLRDTTVFASEIDREIAIATMLMGMEQWGAAVEGLRSVGDPLQDSGEALLLLAISLLEEPVRDVQASKQALDRVTEICGDQPGFLRRVASIAMADAELRKDARSYINMLGELASDQAEIMRLADTLYQLPAGEGVPLDLQERGRRITRRSDAPPVSWSLYLDILLEAFERERSRGGIEEMERLQGLLREEGGEFASRFPNNPDPLNRQSRIMLLAGESEEAALLARGALNKIIRRPVLGDVQLLARAEYLAGNYDLAINTLAPFESGIRADPDSRPASWQILFASMLLDGRVSVAREMYVDRSIRSGGKVEWLNWLSVAEQANATEAIGAVNVVMESSEDLMDKLLAIGVLTSVYRKTSDPVLITRGESIFAEMEEKELSDVLSFRLKLAKIELDGAADETKAVIEAESLFNSIDPAVISLLDRRDDLEGSDRELADAYFVPMCVFLNNFVARTADLVIAGKITPERATPILASCDQAELWLARLLPNNLDVLDSRARLKLAVGRLDEALEMARFVISQSAGSYVFNLTLAEILLARGDFRGAEKAADYALRFSEFEKSPDSKILMRLREVIEKCRTQARRDLEVELEVLA